ncbi:MAG: hypothetical protein AAF982_03535 [Pseudomonadota bacterium]
MKRKAPETAAKTPARARDERLKAMLRENLKRRKAQARARGRAAEETDTGGRQ